MTVIPYRFSSLRTDIEWLTGVTRSYTTERRDKLRATPRLVLKPTYALLKESVSEAAALIQASGGIVSVPDWRYEQKVLPGFSSGSLDVSVDNSYASFSLGDNVLIWESEYSFTEASILAVAGSTLTLSSGPAVAYGAASLLPLYEAVVTQDFNSSSKDGVVYDASLELTVTEYTDLSSYFVGDTLSGLYVAPRDVISSASTSGVHVAVSNVDMHLGSIQVVRKASVDTWSDKLQFYASFGKGVLEMESVFHHLSGRLNSFWKPTWLPDLALLAAASSGQFYLRVDVVTDALTIEAIAVELLDGSVQYYEVTGRSSTASYTQLSLLEPLTRSFTPADVVSISLMRRSRLDSDTVVIDFDSTGGATASAATASVAV